jgi:hypothetical protein
MTKLSRVAPPKLATHGLQKAIHRQAQTMKAPGTTHRMAGHPLGTARKVKPGPSK